MTHLRLAYRRTPPPDNWRRCDICEWVFFRFIIPLLVAAALIGWWGATHGF